MCTFGHCMPPQGRYWILTVPKDDWTPSLPDGCSYVYGQCERGESGYEHWQFVAYFGRKVRLGAVKRLFGNTAHAELSRSAAVESYVRKEETAISGTQFEYGTRPRPRNTVKDWSAIWESAKRGSLSEIPADVLVRYYGNVKRIAVDHCCPVALERVVNVYWGRTGTGKSRRAWGEATLEAYPKDPRSKFWDGYNGQDSVVIDEFRGGIDVSHMLRWLDRYPVLVEVKGSSAVLKASKVWITSNLAPEQWYPGLDPDTLAALLRRLNILSFE